MSAELKVKIPDGYRWVKMNEERTGKWLYQCAGVWRESQDQYSYSDWYYITPIEPPKPDTVDVEITESGGRLWFVNPQYGELLPVYAATSIVGFEWAFAGFVWESGSVNLQYVDVVDDKIIYAKAVRFRRVQGGAK